LRKKYTAIPETEMPIYGANGSSSNIEILKTPPRFDIGVLDEGE
jgi:hypothetical protein